VRAREINETMKLAAAKAIAALAREPVPDYVLEAYGAKAFTFGIDYVIPKPLDLRLVEYVSGAVAESAMATGVARKTIDAVTYREDLRNRLTTSRARIESLVKAYGW
jgi:malate dehydrogenase (oxaloacetate-decarboxylating)(NADP+)